MPPSKMPQENTTTDKLSSDERRLSSKAWRNDVYEELSLAGMDKIAERWLTCSDNFKTRVKPVEFASIPASTKIVYVCTGDHTHEAEIYSQSCDLRICPDCARMHSARLVHRYLPKVMELFHQHHPTYRFRHIVFTTPYALTDKDIRRKYLLGFKNVYRVMNKLMSRKGDWKTTQGFFDAGEFGEEGRKLHFHVIHYGQYLNQVDLSNGWFDATGGDASVVWVRGLHQKNMNIEDEIREVLKYATKFYSTDKVTKEVTYIPPADMPVLAKILEKSRRVRSYGVFYNLPEPDRADHTCETCNSPMIGIPPAYFETYCNTGMLPREFDRARTDALLHLRTADKSFQQSSGLPPPEAGKPAHRQKLFDEIARLRKKDDWS